MTTTTTKRIIFPHVDAPRLERLEAAATTSSDSSAKTVTLAFDKSTTTKVTTPKPRIKRVVTHSQWWQGVTDQQSNMLPHWLQEPEPSTDTKIQIQTEQTADAKRVHQQILAKISGYKSQDQHKDIYDPAKFVTFCDVLNLLNPLTCYYCKEDVQVLYDFQREPRQWTLERLDNMLGHNRDNVVLACLKCNLRRRTMLVSKYKQTQEMKHVCKLFPELPP